MTLSNNSRSLEARVTVHILGESLLTCAGIKSLARKQALDFTAADLPQPTGLAACRTTFYVDLMKQDPGTARLVEKAALNFW